MAAVAIGTGDGKSHHGPGPYLSEAQLATLWAHVNPDLAHVAWPMARIAKHVESNGDPLAVSPTGCVGLWQLCPPQAGDEHPVQNAKRAGDKFRASGFQPWAAFSSANAAIAHSYQANPHAASNTRPVGLWEDLQKFGGGLFSGPQSLPGTDPLGINPHDNPLGGGDPSLNPLSGISGAIAGVSQALADIANAIKGFLDYITSSETWLSVGKILAGAVMTAMALWGLYQQATR